MKNVIEMRKKREESAKQGLAILEKAKAENRVVTEDEQKQYDEICASVEAIDKQIDNEIKAQVLSMNAASSVAVKTDAGDQPFESFGHQLLAIKNACADGGHVDQRLLRGAQNASGVHQGTGSDGGFLVDTQFIPTLIDKQREASQLYSRIDKVTVGANFNGVSIPTIDESSRADGSRFGGVQAYWLAEAASATASKPKFGKLKMDLEKLMAISYATEEMLQDVSVLGSVMANAYGKEMGFKLDDAILNGDGSGKPLGIMNAPALVTVAKESGQAADTVVAKNIFKMWSRLYAPNRGNAVWLINQDVEPQLFGMYLEVGTGGVPIYMPANGVAGQPFSTLMGRPVIPVEQCDTVGDLGDIVLVDLSEYLGIEKGGMKSDVSIHVRFIYDESCFKFTTRFNGQPKWASALTPKNSTNTLSPFVTLAARA